eukprot:2058280-Rhodomonas_salina.3
MVTGVGRAYRRHRVMPKHRLVGGIRGYHITGIGRGYRRHREIPHHWRRPGVSAAKGDTT